MSPRRPPPGARDAQGGAQPQWIAAYNARFMAQSQNPIMVPYQQEQQQQQQQQPYRMTEYEQQMLLASQRSLMTHSQMLAHPQPMMAPPEQSMLAASSSMMLPQETMVDNQPLTMAPQQQITVARPWQQRGKAGTTTEKNDRDSAMEEEEQVYEMKAREPAPELERSPAMFEQDIKPNNQQMKAKTDGKTISVRKTDLLITFHHTRLVKNDDRIYVPPSSKAQLHVYPVGMYPEAFPPGTTGVFIPMKSNTSLRISFQTRMKCGRNPYLIRVYAGTVNIISGKVDFKKQDGKEQDYIVVPDQEHIDGFAVTNEKARQFKAPTEGPGFSFDWPYEQEEPHFSNLRFEITPFEFEHVGDFFVRANGWMDRKMMLPIRQKEQMRIPARIQKYFGIDSTLTKWKYRGRKFPEDWTVEQVGVPPDPERRRNDTIDITTTQPVFLTASANRLEKLQSKEMLNHSEYNKDYRYFIKPLINDPEEAENKVDRDIVPTRAIQTGGQVEQFIAYDPYPNLWNPKRTTIFEVHIVGAEKFKEITEMGPKNAPEHGPPNPEAVRGEEEEVDAYKEEVDFTLDEPIEKFEIRNFGATFAPKFTSVRDHIVVRRQS